MEVYERINYLLKEKNTTKREFAKRLIEFEPRLKSTGEPPTEKTIYGYLSGKISISLELIPFIAKALNISEQELFFTAFDSKLRFYKKIVQNASEEELFFLQKELQLRRKFEKEIEQCDIIHIENNQNSDIEKLINLLNFAPKPLVKILVMKLEELKKLAYDVTKL